MTSLSNRTNETLTVGVDVELPMPATAEQPSLLQALFHLCVLAESLGAEFRIGLLNGCDVIHLKLILIDIL